MASLKGLVAIVSKLRVERANLLNRLKNVDAALSVLGKLNRGRSYSARKRMSPSRKAKRTAIVQPTRDLGFELLPELDLNRGGRLRTLEEVERHYIRQVLQGEGGHIESAARKLGIPRSSLYHKLKRYQRRSA